VKRSAHVFVVRAYQPKEPISRKTFGALWSQLGEKPFQATGYDQVERTKHQYERQALESAYTLYRDSFIIVRGQASLLMLMTAHPLEPVSISTLWINDIAKATTTHREAWLDWIGRFLSKTPVVFAMGCVESEFRKKHQVDRHASGVSYVEELGWRPQDFEKALPGIYWMNYYGSEIETTIGARVRANTALATRDLEHGKLLAILKAPLVPDDLDARVTLEREIANDIAPNCFFDKDRLDAPKQQVPEIARMLRTANTSAS
jgi:hypothetical protein